MYIIDNISIDNISIFKYIIKLFIYLQKKIVDLLPLLLNTKLNL